jgi:hypothetical protein
VSLAIGDSIWGDIPVPKPASHSKENKIQTRLKLEDIIPHLPSVDEICTQLAGQILEDPEQRESKVHIVALQKALDKPLHRGALSLATEESFMIMDLRNELILSKEIMLAAVQNRSSPWKRAVETLLNRKKQIFEFKKR